MKLNNKGFAFSTMLYGTLALITVILYMILGISQSANDETFFYGDEIQAKLNECVYDEVALENCYSAHTTECDATAYHACLGISDNHNDSKGELIAETLKKKVVTANDGLYADPLIANRYIFRGSNVNNYIKYSNKLWRILSIEPDGRLKLIDYNSSTTMSWDSNGQDNWTSSTLHNYLTGNYLSGIDDISGLFGGQWDAAFIRPSASTTGLSINEYKVQLDSQAETATSSALAGMVTIYDYMNAASNNSCRQHMLTQTGCTSWLSNYKGWTININGEDTENKAYILNNNNGLSLAKTSEEHRVYPVVVLDRNSVIGSGEGTASSPYVLK